ncbi:FtsK/SpoIIIE family DNA translocase [Natronospora cellulosivora (SeqCode)]
MPKKAKDKGENKIKKSKNISKSRKKTRNTNKDKNKSINQEILEKRKNEILGILIIALAILSSIAIFTDTAGIVGQELSNFYDFIIGRGSFVIPLLLFSWGITLIRLKGLKINSRLIGFFLFYISMMSLIHTYFFMDPLSDPVFTREGGGILAGSLSWISINLFGRTGSYVMISASLLIGFLLWLDVLLISILRKIKVYLNLLFTRFKKVLNNKFLNPKEKNAKKDMKTIESNDLVIDVVEEEDDIFSNSDVSEDIVVVDEVYAEDFTIDDVDDEEEKPKNQENDKKLENDKKNNKNNDSQTTKSNVTNEENSNYQYRLPSIKLLKDSNKNRKKPGNKSNILEETLNSFGVKAKVLKVNHGPTITRYEIQPASGVKVSKIVNLADDIALSLAAPGVRIEAPIPGKAAVGVEVPHMKNITITLRDIISSRQFSKAEGKLDLALGMGIDGKPIISDLSKMPHLLVAGATGSGKSVCINTIITSILYQAKPNEVKMLLIDPKKVELTSYKGLPHLFAPVVTDPKKAASVLKLVVDEMENRYELFSGSGTRGIESYNKKCSDEDKLPYIVVIIDELSDLMMVAANDVEDNICRLAQMARAAGIHLVIATQRPSVDVITGLIKANIPSRISFAVSSQTDSRTILDMGGAEKLLGKGDMLLAPAGTQKPQRVQGAFINNDEINDIVDFVKNQANPDYIFDLDDINEIKIEMDKDDERDDLYQEAIKLVVNYRASISMLQRRLHVGHSRAARMIDMMEEDGIVGPYAGSKAREVLVSKEDLDEFLANGSTKNLESEEV